MLWLDIQIPAQFLLTRIQSLSEMEGLGQMGTLIATQDKSLFILASKGVLSL